MKIECIIRRPKGTKVELQGIEYHFKPNGEDVRHIANIENQVHIRQLLRIPEGYKALEEVPVEVQGELDSALQLVGSKVHAASYDIKGEKIALEELVAMAFDDSGIDRDAWNALCDEARYGYIDTTLSELQGPLDPEPDSEPTDIKPESELNTTPDEPSVVDEQPNVEKLPGPTPEELPKAEVTGQALDYDALVVQYQAKFGKKPHYKLSAERIKQVLEEA